MENDFLTCGLFCAMKNGDVDLSLEIIIFAHWMYKSKEQKEDVLVATCVTWAVKPTTRNQQRHLRSR